MSTKRLATASKKRGSKALSLLRRGLRPRYLGGAIASGGRPVYFVCIPLCFLPCSLPVFAPCTPLPDGSFTRPSCRRLLQWIVRCHFYENAFWSFFDGCRGGKNDQKAFSPILSVGWHCARQQDRKFGRRAGALRARTAPAPPVRRASFRGTSWVSFRRR